MPNYVTKPGAALTARQQADAEAIDWDQDEQQVGYTEKSILVALSWDGVDALFLGMLVETSILVGTAYAAAQVMMLPLAVLLGLAVVATIDTVPMAVKARAKKHRIDRVNRLRNSGLVKSYPASPAAQALERARTNAKDLAEGTRELVETAIDEQLWNLAQVEENLRNLARVYGEDLPEEDLLHIEKAHRDSMELLERMEQAADNLEQQVDEAATTWRIAQGNGSRKAARILNEVTANSPKVDTATAQAVKAYHDKLEELTS